MNLTRRTRALSALMFAGMLLVSTATESQAAPVTYVHTGGTATITLTLGNDPTIIGSANLPITGVFATFDEAAIELVDFDFQAEGAIPFNPGVNWGGFSDVILNNARLNPGAGYSHLSQIDQGGGQYFVSVNPVEISTTVTATGAGSLWDGSPISGQGPTSATINVFGTGNQMLSINGITIGQIAGDSVYLPSAELEDLTIKADLVFEGQVPEPGVGILLVMAGGALLCSRRLRNR